MTKPRVIGLPHSSFTKVKRFIEVSMFKIDPFFGILAFLVTYFVSRIINERALRKLSIEDKARLLDAFSNYRIYSTLAVLSIPLAHIGLSRLQPQLAWRAAPFLFVLFVGSLALVSMLTYRKLKGLRLPEDYIKSFLLSTLVQYVGIALLFAPMVGRFSL